MGGQPGKAHSRGCTGHNRLSQGVGLSDSPNQSNRWRVAARWCSHKPGRIFEMKAGHGGIKSQPLGCRGKRIAAEANLAYIVCFSLA